MKNKKLFLFSLGLFILVGGISLVLAWWPAVVGLFKGLAGMTLAVAGLLLMYFAGKK